MSNKYCGKLLVNHRFKFAIVDVAGLGTDYIKDALIEKLCARSYINGRGSSLIEIAHNLVKYKS